MLSFSKQKSSHRLTIEPCFRKICITEDRFLYVRKAILDFVPYLNPNLINYDDFFMFCNFN